MSGTPVDFRFPKSARILKSSEFRKVYREGVRISGSCFAAFCLAVARKGEAGPRLGFTLPRAFGGAVKRNRAKRRIREALRVRLAEIDPRWDVVLNPRRAALAASRRELETELERLISRCKRP